MFHLEFAIGPESLESFFPEFHRSPCRALFFRYTLVIFNMEAGKFHPC